MITAEVTDVHHPDRSKSVQTKITLAFTMHDFLKTDAAFEVHIYGFSVQVKYAYNWLNTATKEPLVVHFEFRSASAIISGTGYRSHFVYLETLKQENYSNLKELAIAIGEHLARENGFTPPEHQSQLSLF